MAYSIDAITDDCYSGTTCLINKLGIQDENMLAETEAAIILGKVSLLEQSPIPEISILIIISASTTSCSATSMIGREKYARLTFPKREQRSSQLIKSRIVLRRAFPGWRHSKRMD